MDFYLNRLSSLKYFRITIWNLFPVIGLSTFLPVLVPKIITQDDSILNLVPDQKLMKMNPY